MKNPKLRKLESELDANLQLQQQLKIEETHLRLDIRKADVPPAPPESAGDMFRVIVQFSTQGPQYTYLLARKAGADVWFTTGTHEDQKKFTSWEALCGWLNTTCWHSHLDRLQVNGRSSFPTEHTDEGFVL